MNQLYENYNNNEFVVSKYFDKNFKPTLMYMIKDDKELRDLRDLLKEMENLFELEIYLNNLIGQYYADFMDSEKGSIYDLIKIIES